MSVANKQRRTSVKEDQFSLKTNGKDKRSDLIAVNTL